MSPINRDLSHWALRAVYGRTVPPDCPVRPTPGDAPGLTMSTDERDHRAGVTGKEETGMKTMNGRRIHALFQVWIVQS